MSNLIIDSQLSDDARRQRLYEGDLFLYSANEHSRALVSLARNLIGSAFPDEDPVTAQFNHPVEEYAAILTKLKPGFIHHPECKEIIPRMLGSLGCELEQTYFDVPRMRSSTSNDYLTSGIAYAFHPHRDTWYSAPMCQINWWIPIYDIEPGNAMAFHPRYFNQAVKNSSDEYNYQEWNATQRFKLDKQIKKDTRRQPKPLETIELEPSTVVVAPPGSMLLFSAAQLHSSVPNLSGKTRFSIDFRVVNERDLRSRIGARNIDSMSTGSPINDYLQGATLSHVPKDVQDQYLTGHPQRAIA